MSPSRCPVFDLGKTLMPHRCQDFKTDRSYLCLAVWLLAPPPGLHERVVSARPDDHVISRHDPDQLACRPEALGEIAILRARIDRAAWMILGEDDAVHAGAERLAQHVAR